MKFRHIITPTTDKRLRLYSFLVFLVSYFVLYLLTALSLGFPFGMFLFFVLLIPTVLIILGVWFFTGKVKFAPIYQWCLYLIPVLLVFIFPYVIPHQNLPNQVQNLKSPNEKYVLSIPIERNKNYHNEYVWTLTIKDEQGKILYQDNESNFLGRFNVYWVWDQANIAWLYNSDDGHVYYWINNNNRWMKSEWGFILAREGKWEIHQEADKALTPPEGLFPESVREHFRKLSKKP